MSSRTVLSALRPKKPLLDKRCAVCRKRSSGWGFKPVGQPLKWFCDQHREQGDAYLKA